MPAFVPACLRVLLHSVLVCALGGIATVQAQDAVALKARHAALGEALASNPFQRPLVLESSESERRVQGDVYARVEQPFAVLGAALQAVDRWCDILILHLNVKQCRIGTPAAPQSIHLVVGQKYDQAFEQAHRLAFGWRIVTSRPDYLQVVLAAEEGPLGTSDYRIVLEGTALDARRSFLHLSYSYSVGVAARLAMQGYLATFGRNKVGFSVVGRKPDGQPEYVGGTRGVVERNTMRYYLAIEAYLGALSLPPAQQFEKRLAAWHAGVERYPRQLHELEWDEYLSLKREQMRRQQAPG